MLTNAGLKYGVTVDYSWGKPYRRSSATCKSHQSEHALRKHVCSVDDRQDRALRIVTWVTDRPRDRGEKVYPLLFGIFRSCLFTLAYYS